MVEMENNMQKIIKNWATAGFLISKERGVSSSEMAFPIFVPDQRLMDFLL